MAGFEDLIRGALEKQGNTTPQTRASIYHSSRQALERMLGQSTTLDDKVIAVQRQRLEAAIAQIEADYGDAPTPHNPTPQNQTVQAPPVQSQAPGVPPPPSPVIAPKPATAAPPPAPRSAARPVHAEPAIDAQPTQLEPAINGTHEGADLQSHSPVYQGNVLEERKPYAKLLLWTIILVGLGVSAWWAVNFGPDMIKQKLGGSVPNPSQIIESGGFLPSSGEGWISVFNPADDSANIDANGKGTADLFQDGERNFVRLASNAGSDGNYVRIKVPRGVMLPLRGEAATFEVMLKNNSDTPQQFALFCEFGDMGGCGRKRFRANDRIEAFIFDVLVNDTPLPENQDAYIRFNTDLGGNGKTIDLYSIRVRSGG